MVGSVAADAAVRLTGGTGAKLLLRNQDEVSVFPEDDRGLTGEAAILIERASRERQPFRLGAGETGLGALAGSIAVAPVAAVLGAGALLVEGVGEESSLAPLAVLASAAAGAVAAVGRQAFLTRHMDELSALYRLTDSLYRARSRDDIFAAALDTIVSVLGNRASILLFDEAGVMRFVAWRGLSENYRTKLSGHSPWKLGDRNPQPIFVEDIDDSDESESVKETIKAEGIRGLAFIPLVEGDRVIGKFMAYYPARHAFGEAETALAVTIARQVGFSLARARAEEARRQAEESLRESERRFRLMSEQAPVMIWTSDPAGHCLHLNQRLRRFWGVRLEDIPRFDWSTTMHPEDAPEIGRRMMEAVMNRASVTVDGRYRNADGAYRVLRTDARPRFSVSGEFLGMIGVNTDITEREESERALRDSEARFRLAVEAAPSGMVMTDPAGRIILVNAVAEGLFGYDRSELVGQGIDMLVPERFRSGHPDLRKTYLNEPHARPMGAGRDLYALRKDGTEIPVEIGLSPIDAAEGVVVLAAIVDISERKRAEAQRELLVAELNHRVKNTLAIVQGIAHQTFRSGGAAPEARSAFEGRLVALSTAHNLLTQSNWENAALATLVRDASRAQGVDESRVVFDGPSVLLPAKPALAISIALHELFTNAVKYGALSNDTGRVDIAWRREEGTPPRLSFNWRESGGPPVVPPSRRGFGSRLIEQSLALDLDGEVTMRFDPNGLVCIIRAPIRTPPKGAA